MGIEWVRDLSISIFGFVATVSIIAVAVISWYIYRELKSASNQTKRMVKAVEETVGSVKETVDTVREEVIKPMTCVSSLVAGIRAGIEHFRCLTKGREAEGGGKND